MEMKQYLIDTFRYNDYANKMVLNKIRELQDKTQAIKFFSHLINSQDKWLDRINLFPESSMLDWWEPVHELDKLEEKWNKSIQAWIDFLQGKNEEELFKEVKWIGFDNGTWTAELKDIALQLNYHSIHHRAQIQTIIRSQGLTPDFVDYIGTRYRKVSGE